MIKSGGNKAKKVQVVIRPGEIQQQEEDIKIQNIKQISKSKKNNKKEVEEKSKKEQKKQNGKSKKQKQQQEIDIFSDQEEDDIEEVEDKIEKKQKKKQQSQRKSSQLSDLSDMYIEEEEEEEEEEKEEEKPKKKEKKQEKQQYLNKKKKEKITQKKKTKQQKQQEELEDDIENITEEEQEEESKKRSTRNTNSQKQKQQKLLKEQQQLQEEYEETITEKMGLGNQERNKKKWDDKGKKTGKFSDEEVQILQHAVCQYAKEKSMNEQDLIDFIQIPRSQASFGAWSKIASYLPDRSVQSCHNFIKRKYNPLNYKGRWSEDEVRQLIELVEYHGNKWETIGKEIGRTAQNCRDKLKSMGGVNHQDREKLWTLEEIIKVMKYIEKKVKVKFISRQKMEEFFTEFPELLTEKIEPVSDSNNRKRRSKYSDEDKYMKIISDFIEYEKIKNISFENINWTKIAEKLKTKSYVDCRNKWQHQLKACLLKDMGFTEQQDTDLIQQIKQQFVDAEEDIDFSQINNGKEFKENRQRFYILKKRLNFEKLGNQNLEATLRQLKSSFRKNTKNQYICKKEEDNNQQNNNNNSSSNNNRQLSTANMQSQSSIQVKVEGGSNPLLSLFKQEYVESDQQLNSALEDISD